MITAEEFNRLDTVDQIKIAMQHDTLIGHRGEGPKSMHLYRVGDFYVEVVFTTKRKAVIDVIASHEDDILDPYLDQIDLTELFI